MSRVGGGDRSLTRQGPEAGQIRPKQAKSVNVIHFLVSSTPSQFSEQLVLAE